MVKVAFNVTPKTHKADRAYLYIAEWMEEKGLSDERLSVRLRVDRSTIFRWRKEQWRLDPPKMTALADALGINVQDLFRHPRRPSIDAILENATDDVYEATAELARRLSRRPPTR